MTEPATPASIVVGIDGSGRRYGRRCERSGAAPAPADMVFVDARNGERIAELIGPVADNSALREADCSLLIVNRQHL